MWGVNLMVFLFSGVLHRNQFRPSRGGYFILQLHDELIYEVAEEDAIQVIKKTIECINACPLSLLKFFKP